MKRLISLLLLVVAFSLHTIAQTSTAMQDASEGGVQILAITDLECPGNSIYSQTPDGSNAIAASSGTFFADNILTGPSVVNSITWWMGENFNVTDPNLHTFDIVFHEDNAGEPGTAIASFLGVSPAFSFTGEVTGGGRDIYEFTYDFPLVNLPAGAWVSIRDYPENALYWYWLTSSDGDNTNEYYNGSSFTTDLFGPADLAFCIGYTPDFGEVVDICMFPAGSGQANVKIRPRFFIDDNFTISEIRYTVRWSDATLNITSVNAIPPFAIAPDGPVYTPGDGYFYQNFITIAGAVIGFPINPFEEVPIATFNYTGVNGAQLQIINNAFTASQNIDYYIEVNGVERTGTIYCSFDTVPVSNWAILIAIALISLFTVLLIRRIV